MEGREEPGEHLAAATVCLVGDAETVEGWADRLRETLEPSVETVVTSLDAASERVHALAPDCLVVTDRVDEDSIAVLSELVDEFDGHVVFAAAAGDERLASDAVAVGADDYVPVGTGSGRGAAVDGLADRIGSALAAADAGRDPARLVETLPGAVCLVDDDVVVHADDRLRKLFGTEGNLVDEPVDSVLPARVVEVVRSVSATGPYPSPVVVEGVGPDDRDVELFARRTAEESGEVVLLAHDVTDRRGRERRLATLHETTREMLRTSDPATIAETAVDAAVQTLDPLSVSVYLYDRDEGDLRVGATASGVAPSVGPTAGPRSDGHEEFAWETFVDGRPDVRRKGDDGEWTGSRVAVPLGDHGVLVVARAGTDAFDAPDVEFAKTFATNVELALERAHRETTILDRTERLRERTETLDRLRRIDDVVRDIGQLLVRGRDRPEIESGVCDRLAAVDGWPTAWIGERSVTDDRIRPRCCSDDGTFFEAVTAADPDAFGAGPPGEALSSGSLRRVEDVVASQTPETWRRTALEFGFRSAVSIPLEHAGREFGVLEVYGDAPGAFGEEERRVLVELGEMIAYALHAVERHHALLADAGPELEVSVRDPQLPFVELADDLGTPVSVEGAVARSSGGFLAYFSTDADDDSDPGPETVAAAVERRPSFGHLRELGDGHRRHEVQLRSAPLFDRISENGGTVEEYVADQGGCTLRIRLASTVDVRTFVEALQDRFPDVEVLAQRTPEGDARESVETLTERQREVLAVAYHSGFFEWPRGSSGEAVAETLGIAPPTFHKHVRSAERKLVARLLEGGATGGRTDPEQW